VYRSAVLALAILLLAAGCCRADNIFTDFLASVTPDEAGAVTVVWPVKDVKAGVLFSWGPVVLTSRPQQFHLHFDLLTVDGKWGVGASIESSDLIDLLRLEEWFPLPWHRLLDETRTGACGWKEEGAAFGIYLLRPLAQF